jgi:hypothetical protein
MDFLGIDSDVKEYPNAGTLLSEQSPGTLAVLRGAVRTANEADATRAFSSFTQ